MLFNLLAPLADDLVVFNLFRYLTFRTGGAILTGLLVSFAFGPAVIRWLRAHKVGEDVTKTDSKDLAKMTEQMGKKNTPTMGGSFLIAALIASVLHKYVTGRLAERAGHAADAPRKPSARRRGVSNN